MQKADRAVSVIEWVSKEERAPTEEDADRYGAILARHEYNGVVVTTPHIYNHYGTYMLAWAKIPE